MKIYISGKITGLPEEEAKAMFQAAEDFLLDKYKNFEIEVSNPLKLDHTKAELLQLTGAKQSDHKVWVAYMGTDLEALLNCKGIYMLKNWGSSKGARIEHVVAKEMGLTVEYEQ